MKERKGDKYLTEMCKAYFGKERAEKYRKDPDDVMTGILLDIQDYGYERAMAMHRGDDYDSSYSVDLGGKTLV